VRVGTAAVRCAPALAEGGVDDEAATVGNAPAAELATGTGADPEVIALVGAPPEVGGAAERVPAAETGWWAVQPEIISARPTPMTPQRTRQRPITGVAPPVPATSNYGAGAR
jgi:hypothetical protein